MKKAVFAIFFLILFFGFSFPFSAETFEEIEKSQKEAFGLDDLQNSFPDQAEDFYGEEVEMNSLSSVLSPEKILSSLMGAITDAFAENRGFFYGLAVILCGGLFLRLLSEAYPQSRVLSSVETLLVLSSALLLCGGIFSSVGVFEDCISGMNSFSLSLIPVVTGLASASGRPAFGTFASSFLFFSVEFFSAVLAGFALPCTKVFLASGIGGSLSENEGLQKFTAASKNFLIAAIGFIFCLFIGMFSLQSFLSASADSLTKQSLKFAAGSFVPVAGGYIAESLETFYACAEGLKNTSGVFGILTVFALSAVPAANLVVKYLLLRIAEGVSGMFGNKALASFFGISKDAFSVLFSVAVGYGAMLMLMLVIVMRSG